MRFAYPFLMKGNVKSVVKNLALKFIENCKIIQNQQVKIIHLIS